MRTDVVYSQILEKLGSVEAKVELLVSKPSKRWETVVAVAITAVITGLITYSIGTILK